jgi:hypothetical protein
MESMRQNQGSTRDDFRTSPRITIEKIIPHFLFEKNKISSESEWP